MSEKEGVPQLRDMEKGMIGKALRRAIADMKAAPSYGIFFAVFYVLGGLFMAWLTYSTGTTFWLVLACLGFPMIGPFAAVGLYEVSRRRSKGLDYTMSDILGVIWRQSQKQLPSLCVIIVVVFLFWFFLGHMIFALFMGLSVMTNVSSSLDVFFTPNGLMMLSMGTAVGAIFCLILFMISVFSIPLLLDRDIDFMTAMLTSFTYVQRNFLPMLLWGALIAVCVLLSLIPWFLGLFITLPLFGHASWHLYELARINEEEA